MSSFRRIALFAAAWAYNLGDEVIVLSEVGYLRERYPDCRVAVFTYDSKSTLLPESWNVGYFPYFPNGFRRRPFANVGYFFRTVWEIFRSDLVVIGGGGILYDNEAGQSFAKQAFEWKLRTAIAGIFRKKTLFWGIGVDVRPENARKLRWIFTWPRTIVTVRDSKSAEILGSIGISARVVPDPAFLVESVRNGEAPKREGKTVGISVRKGYLREETDSLRSIARIVRERGFSPLFLNHSFHPGNPETDDREFVARLAEEEGMASTDSLSASLDAYRSLDAVIAMRLHAGVLSFVNGIPFFLLSYSKKTDAFAERVGSPWILAASEFDETAFSEAFDRFITEYGESRVPFFALKEKYGRIKRETRNSFDDTFYGLESAEK